MDTQETNLWPSRSVTTVLPVIEPLEFAMATAKAVSSGCGSGAGLGAGAGAGTGTETGAKAGPPADERQGMKVLEEAAGFSLPVNFNGNLVAATTDEQLTEILSTAKASRRMAVVNYGASWCQACKQMLPTFCNLSNEYPSSLFVYADIDKCEHTTQDVRYTPTFRFYKDGTRVDEFYGGGAQKLRDRVWLQS